MTATITNLHSRTSQVRWFGWISFDVLRRVLGAVLLSAAILKGWQLATEPTAAKGLLASRWFLIVGVEVEWLLGLWLVSGLYKRLAWLAALSCFTLFCGITLYKAVSGESSCGCFGRIAVSPWYTLVFDAVSVMALLGCRAPLIEWRSNTHLRTRLALLVCLGSGIGVLGAVFMMRVSPARISQAGQIIGDSRFVVLEPQQWVGKQFPLLGYIDVGERLARGNWRVVLYHHGCPACQELIPVYEKEAAQLAHADGLRTALIELPPYAQTERAIVSSGSVCLLGRLGNMKEWFVETPAVLTLHSGEVAMANTGM